VARPDLPSGSHPFALYRWQRHGVRTTEEFVGVAADARVAEQVLELLQSATVDKTATLPQESEFDALDAVHHQLWLSASSQHTEENRQLVQVLIQSLTASHAARRSLLEGQLARATNEKIRVMKAAEIERAQADYDHRMAQLEKAAESGDLKASPVVFGMLRIGPTP
jgi:hypothetical protein